MAVRRLDEDGEPDEFSVAYTLGEEFASYDEGLNAPTTEQFKNPWQAQVARLREGGGLPALAEPPPAAEPPLPPVREKILLVEDDEYLAQDYANALRAQRFRVLHVPNPDRALEVARQDRHFGAVVIDIRMNPGNFFGKGGETDQGRRTGVCLAGELQHHLPDTAFIALTLVHAPDVAEWFEGHEGFGYCVKSDMPPARFARYLRRIIFHEKPRAFIVHGHDLGALGELRDYLVGTLGFKKPFILKDERSGGKTVMEKLEHYADKVDVVFALLTPDDLIVSPETPALSGRARQNVIYEIGLFHAHFGRESGNVILLSKQGVERPSDLSGLILIDITGGILAADEEIRRELRAFLPPGPARSLN